MDETPARGAKHDTEKLLVFAFLIVCGLVFYLLNITHDDLWYDESCSAAVVKQPLGEIWKVVMGDRHPPLYFSMLKIFTLAAGASVFSLRLFSALGAVAILALGVFPVRRIFGFTTGFLFAFIAAFTPFVYSMAQEVRMYTWAAFFVTAAFLFGCLSVRENKTGDWVKFGLASLAAAYTHYYALVAVAGIHVFMLACTLLKKRPLAVRQLAVSLLVLLGYLPWVYALYAQMNEVMRGFWIGSVGWGSIVSTFLVPHGYQDTPLRVIFLILEASLLCCGLVLAFLRKRPGQMAALMAVSVYLLTFLCGIALSVLVRPVWVERYIFPVLGLYLLALAYAVSSFKARPVLIVACLSIACLSYPSISFIIMNRTKGPMREAVEYLKPRIGQDDVFIHANELTLGTFVYYVPGRAHFLYLPDSYPGNSDYSLIFRPDGAATGDLNRELEGKTGIWYVKFPPDRDGLAAELDVHGLRAVSAPAEFSVPQAWFRFLIVQAARKAG